MSGKTELLFYPVIAISIIAAVTDLTRGRIYNWLTLPALLIGVLASAALGGWSGIGQALLGVLAGFMLYGWMFWLGVMGGGDIKLLMALGAWGGFRFTVEVALLGLILGGVMAIGVLALKGRIGDFYRRMHHFFLTVFIKELELESPRLDRKLTMPYGVPIAIAAIWIAVANPFDRWGLRLW